MLKLKKNISCKTDINYRLMNITRTILGKLQMPTIIVDLTNSSS